jgi:hypothetical protein
MSASDRPKPPSTAARDVPDPDDPPSEEELRAAEALRRVLEGAGEGRSSELARAIRAAASTETLSPERHRQILDRAFSAAIPEKDARRVVVALRTRKSKIRYLAAGVAASTLAAAAAIVLLIHGAAPDASLVYKGTSERPERVLARSRTTTELFPEGIARSGGTTDRVDRIAYARAQDFRHNQFARWGAP